MKLHVLYEDNHLLAVQKPAAIPTMGAAPGAPSVLEHAKRYLADKYNKPGKVYLGVVSRLDSPVTGVLLLARTSKAAARLTEAFRNRRVEKRYLAVVRGAPEPAEQRLEHFLRKDDRARRMHATHPEAEGARHAVLDFATLQTGPQHTLLRVAPQTGRKHQIRVQLAKIGHAILGDEKYGGPAWRPGAIALHAWRLGLEHPVRRSPLEITAAPPASWDRLVDRARLLADEPIC